MGYIGVWLRLWLLLGVCCWMLLLWLCSVNSVVICLLICMILFISLVGIVRLVSLPYVCLGLVFWLLAVFVCVCLLYGYDC